MLQKEAIIWLALLVCLLPIATALTLTDTLINASNNILINITPATTIYLDQLIVQNDSVYFDALHSSSMPMTMTLNYTISNRNITAITTASSVYLKQNDSKSDALYATWSDATKNFTIICNQTGSIAIEGLSNARGLADIYYIYHNRTLLGEYTADTYTIPSCSHWSFVGKTTDDIMSESKTNVQNPLLKFAAMIGIIAMVIIAAFVITAFQNGEFTFDTLNWLFWLLIIFALIIVFGLMILGDAYELMGF